MPSSPFDLQNDSLYQEWRDRKLSGYPTDIEELVVPVRDPANLSDSEYQALLQRCRKANMAVYASPMGGVADPDIAMRLGHRFGLNRLDHNWLGDGSGLTSLTVSNAGTRKGYIPYTDRPIKWHTDGYYNTPATQIFGLILHCVTDAPEGGENALMDHEIAYISLREEHPNHVRALMQPDVMTIPPRTDAAGDVERREETGPVFAITPAGELHMRFTERKRNIVWKDTPEVAAAVAALGRILNTPSSYSYRARLGPGMGLICNNVLHDRSGFSDSESQRRLIFRGRYYDRIAGTGWRETP